MSINTLILNKIRTYLVDDGIVVVNGIVNVDMVVNNKQGNVIEIDSSYMPFLKDKNYSNKTIKKDLEEYIHKNIKGTEKVTVSVI